MRNRSSSASGRGYVPSCSRGFSVAITKNGFGSSSDFSPIVTWCSSIASRRADCTFGGVRLISSARRILVKIGHFRTSNFPVSFLYISCHVISDGRRSGVKETRLKSYPSTEARVFTAFVFPSPGTHSISTCPRAKRAMISHRMRSSCQMIVVCIADSIERRMSRVEERWGFIEK